MENVTKLLLCVGLQVTFVTVVSNNIIKHLLNTKWIAFYVQLAISYLTVVLYPIARSVQNIICAQTIWELSTGIIV